MRKSLIVISKGCVDETRYFLPIDDEAKQKLLTPSIKDINRYVIAVAYLTFFELPNLATDLQLVRVLKTPNLDLHQRWDDDI